MKTIHKCLQDLGFDDVTKDNSFVHKFTKGNVTAYTKEQDTTIDKYYVRLYLSKPYARLTRISTASPTQKEIVRLLKKILED